MKKKTYIYLLALVPFLIVAMLYEIVPLITVIVKSFQPDGGTGFTLENYQSVFSKLLYQKAIINSIKISLTSAVAGIIIAFLGARAAHQHQGKLNHVFMTVLNMVSNFAGIPLAFAYMILLGNAGLVVNIGKELGISALSTYNLYIVGRYTGNLLEKSRYPGTDAEYPWYIQRSVCQCSGSIRNDLRINDGQYRTSAGSDRRLLHR